MESNPLNQEPLEESVPFPLLLGKEFLTHQAMQDKQLVGLWPTPQSSQETVLPFPLVFQERVDWGIDGQVFLVQTIDGVTNRTPLNMAPTLGITDGWTFAGHTSTGPWWQIIGRDLDLDIRDDTGGDDDDDEVDPPWDG